MAKVNPREAGLLKMHPFTFQFRKTLFGNHYPGQRVIARAMSAHSQLKQLVHARYILVLVLSKAPA